MLDLVQFCSFQGLHEFELLLVEEFFNLLPPLVFLQENAKGHLLLLSQLLDLELLLQLVLLVSQPKIEALGVRLLPPF